VLNEVNEYLPMNILVHLRGLSMLNFGWGAQPADQLEPPVAEWGRTFI